MNFFVNECVMCLRLYLYSLSLLPFSSIGGGTGDTTTTTGGVASASTEVHKVNCIVN